MSRGKPQRYQIHPQEIAVYAARLMAENWISSPSEARKQILRQLGLPAQHPTPSDEDIRHQLKSHQQLYVDEEQIEILALLFQAAQQQLKQLAHFNPYLTGNLLHGIVDSSDCLPIRLYTDSEKSVELFLLGKGIGYQHISSYRGHGAEALAILAAEVEGYPGLTAELSIFHDTRLHQHRKVSADGTVLMANASKLASLAAQKLLQANPSTGLAVT